MDLIKLKETLREWIEPLGIKLDDLEYVKERKQRILRVTIDRPDGITIDDCVKVSETISPKLDLLDPIPEEYQLEVTSPGAERELKTPEAIQKAIHKYVHLQTLQESIEGILDTFDGNQITILDTKNKPHVFSASDVKKIRLAIKI
ncbi:MAG: ribosome maturation factor RimP [Candidatus Izemoplasmatales bacterium]|jgi:ribosome maturation factor RimP|nr:ribosome maturation factor RimP [Candidatus Izemoplasmatales bacterium]